MSDSCSNKSISTGSSSSTRTLPPSKTTPKSLYPSYSSSQLMTNHALAKVTSRWERARSRQDEETARKMTILKQRKISAVIKVENLQKSLNNPEEGGSLGRLRELEEEVEAIDRELANLDMERLFNERKLNTQRIQHVTALQQLGIFDSLCSLSNERQKSLDNEVANSMYPHHQRVCRQDSLSRCGSDPALMTYSSMIKVNGDENKKPSGPLKNRRSSPGSSPRIGRRNPLRMLSNAIDFRNRRRHPPRTKSEDNGVNEDPSGNDNRHLLSTDETDCGVTASGGRSLPNLSDEQQDEGTPTFHTDTRLSSSHYALTNTTSSPDIIVPKSYTRVSNGNVVQGRLSRAKARILSNGFHSLSSHSVYDSQNNNQNNTHISHHQPLSKLSTRFATSQIKQHFLLPKSVVKRSKTFNISDFNAVPLHASSPPINSMTLPPPKSKSRIGKLSSLTSTPTKLMSSSVTSASSASPSSSSSASMASSSSPTSTSSSRKSSSSSSSSSFSPQRMQISSEAMKEIEAFQEFAKNYFMKQEQNLRTNTAPKKTHKKLSKPVRMLTPQELSEIEFV